MGINNEEDNEEKVVVYRRSIHLIKWRARKVQKVENGYYAEED